MGDCIGGNIMGLGTGGGGGGCMTMTGGDGITGGAIVLTVIEGDGDGITGLGIG